MWRTIAGKQMLEAGTHTSPSVAVTNPLGELHVRGDLPLAQRSDPDYRCRIAIEGSYEASGTTWVTLVSSVYHGGYLQDDGTYANPACGINPMPAGIQRLRCVLDINQRTLIGADVYYVEA